MGNSNVDWAAQSSLVEDQRLVPPDDEQRRRVQRICVLQALNPDGTVDQQQAEDFMTALGVHPKQEPEVDLAGPPLPSPHLALRNPGVLNSMGRS